MGASRWRGWKSRSGPMARARALLAPVLGLAVASAWFAAASAAGVDARAEVAAALYAASATTDVSEKEKGRQITTERARIATLMVQVKAGKAERAQLADAEAALVAQLAAKDQAYAQEVAVFRGALTDIASWPGGAEALVEFNAGGEALALETLDRLRAQTDAARKKASDIASAAAGRQIAQLSLDAMNRGKVTVGSVIARFEGVVALDPGVMADWVALDRLYQEVGRTADARRAAETALAKATDDRQRADADSEIGKILLAQGDLAGSLAAQEATLA